MDKRNATQEDYERHARFLNAIRPWVRAAALILSMTFVWAAWCAFDL